MERPSFKKKAGNDALSPTTKKPFFANRLSERISLKKIENKGDTEAKEKEQSSPIFAFAGGQTKPENRISLFEAKPKIELEWAKNNERKEKDEKSEIHDAPINILFRLTCILKAINLLRMRTFYRPLKYINDDQIELINDTSCHFFSKKEKDLFLKQYTEKNVNFLNKICKFTIFSLGF